MSQIKTKQFKNTIYLYLLCPILLYLFLFNKYFLNDIYLFGFAEWYSPYSIKHLEQILFNALFLFSDTNWGVPFFYPTINLYYMEFLFFVKLFGLLLAQKIIVLSLFYFTFLGGYFLFSKFSNECRISFLLAILFSLNPFILNHIVFGHVPLIINLIQLLFFGYFLIQYFEKNKKKYLVISIMFFALNPIHPMYIPFYIIFYFLTAIYERIEIKKTFFYLLPILFGFFLFNASWIINLIIGSNSVDQVLEYRNYTLEGLKSQSKPLINSFLNSEFFNKALFLNNDKLFQLLFDLSTLIFWLVLLFLIINKNNIKNRKTFHIMLLSSIIVFMFLLTGFFNPLGNQIFIFLIDLKVYQLYREIYHFTFILIPLLFILFSSLLSDSKEKNKKKIAYFICIALVLRLVAVSTYGSTDTFSDKIYAWDTEQLKQNEKIYNLICDKYKTSQYILFVPFYNNVYDLRTNALDKEGGADAFIASNCVATIGNWLPLNYPFNKILSSFQNVNSNNHIFSDLGIKYIIFRKNFVSSSEGQFNTEQLKNRIRSDNNFKLVEDNIFFEIYENEYNSGLLESPNLRFQKINPAKYNIQIKNLKSFQELYFLELFNQNWKLYIKPISINSTCKEQKYYEKTSTTECEYNQKFFEGEELSYLWEKPNFDSTHKVVNEYANGWTIDPEYIKANYSKEYYKIYPDGGMDIELTLYFKPQSYFYLGIIISTLTFVGCIAYLTRGWWRKINE